MLQPPLFFAKDFLIRLILLEALGFQNVPHRLFWRREADGSLPRP